MQQDMKITHVVVDGSNIATEGRDAPSLAQLDEAVQAFVEEYSPKHVTVVVDATFPNRIDRKERKTYEDAVNANELITPPAGAIGRGDAFILQIARRAGAAILSNDSFQEFHGDYPWLFEKGRLIGGKPVPHVGWVFMDRAPVRGPTSRRAVSEARKVAKGAGGAAEPVAAEATETAEAAPPPRRRRSRAKAAAAPSPSEAPTGTTGDGEGSEPAALATVAEEIAAEGVDRGRGGRSPEPYNEALPFIEFVAAHPVGSQVDATIERFSSHGAYVLVGSARAYVPLRNLGDPAPRSAKEVLRVGDDQKFVVVAVDTPRRGIDLALPGVVDVPAPDLAGTADLVAELTVDVTDASAAQVAGEPEAGRAPGRARKAAKAQAKKPSAKKAAAKRTSAKKAAAKKTTAAKAPSEKAAAKKAPAKKTAAKKTAAKKTAAKKTAAKTPASTRDAAAPPAEIPSASDVVEVTGGDSAPVSSDGDSPPARSRRAAGTKAARSTTAAKATKAGKSAKASSATSSPTVPARTRRTAKKSATGGEVVPLASGADTPPEAAQG
jgi:Histone H1-like nucleoprotein HC2/Zc3h12a-like Ribonuclease NYN domain/S1 RNA binding domain